MMLRSSSTPILGSLVPHSDNIRENVGKICPLHENANRISFHSTLPHNYSHSRSLDTSPLDVEKEAKSVSNFRRVQSDGNLESVLSRGSSVQAKVAAESFLQSGSDDYNLPSLSKSWSRRRSAQKKLPYLASVPSFNMYCDEKDEEEEYEGLENFTAIYKAESNMQEFSFENKGVGKIGVKNPATSGDELNIASTEQMFMARGLGIGVMEPLTDTGGGGGNSTHKGISTGGEGDGNGGGFDNIEEHYLRALEVNPANSLILGNYAQFLYETKRDYPKAEEYYARAILAQPDDGDVLAQYAKLIWELHHDEERANVYFEQAVQAAPTDSHVHAAYASFLWNTDGDEDEQEQEDSSFSFASNGYEIDGTATASVTVY
ncbi:uncharacterized protein LOC131030635 [Cryptomeria japonica]|uniref:uncharacterized protein LOC131030635 n=1 Tax=Cryptomeria japonica TaxID=3369 RepID=UPI0025AD3D3C|nr:uncharacterized protein LOC131030635 [Cryptomeria japonica]XP_057817512.1 uncharacterized protein LOC131030635 [Cryptomeria japonica]